MPLSGAASWREPERTQMPTDADRTWSIRSEIIVRPLSRIVCLMGLACSSILHLDGMLTYGLNGAQTEGQKAEGRRQKAEGRKQMTEDTFEGCFFACVLSSTPTDRSLLS